MQLGTGVVGGRACILRRARNQRQRGKGRRRANLEDDRLRVGRDGAQERDDRLDVARERPCAVARARQTHPSQIRLSARQAGKGDSDRIRAGGIALGSLGGRLTHPGPVPDQRL